VRTQTFLLTYYIGFSYLNMINDYEVTVFKADVDNGGAAPGMG